MKKLAVTSGKGGVGKTTTAINLGLALVQQGYRVVVFDADLQLANLDILLGVKSEFNLQHVVAGEKSLAEIVVSGPGGLKVITGGSAVQGLMNAGPKRMGAFLSQLDELAGDFDYMLFDTGAGIDPRVMAFLRLADEVLIVTAPDPAAITDGYAVAKVLLKKSPEAKVHVLVNFVVTKKEADTVPQIFESAVWNFLGQRVNSLGSIQMDSTAVDSARSRVPLLLAHPQSAAAKGYQQVASMLIRSQVKANLKVA